MNKYSNTEINSIIDKMTLDYKVGQLFLLAYPGKDPESIKPLIDKYGISGCYISQDNAETFFEAERTSKKLQEMGSQTPHKIPLLLGVDQEGAWGVLVPESHTGPGNLALGAVADKDEVSRMYEIIGREMLSVGYNALLGPCADVNSDPNSPIIGTRSFGEFPDLVASCVKQAVSGAVETGIITTLKHFPGHGATSGDTHREIPKVDKSLKDLLETDLKPFAAGIRAGADMVMTSHILYPRIDPENPATMSALILKKLLRKQLGFSGVILSDSMNMGAIRKFYDPAESTLLALKAGVDLVMLSEEHYDHSSDYLPKQIASLETVKNAILDGRLSMEEVDEKLFRILSMKLNRMKIKTSPLNKEDLVGFERKESEIALAGFVLVNKGTWPLPKSGKILCVNATPRSSYNSLMNSRGIGPNQDLPAFDSLRVALENNKQFTFLSHEEASNIKTGIYTEASAIVVVTEDYPLPGEDFDKQEQQKLVIRLASQYSDKMIILGLRSSYEITFYPKNVTYLCSYSSRSCSAREAARILSERRNSFNGIAPVSLRV
ncbi:MAG: hypothetical protein KAQ93_04625 [Spirochaetales bacterium]|nr:hypothetical protein [Spirochaetales bacterium]